ncbi:MAG: lytic transglycosylase domain-containing protein, partial [bacterium]
HEANSAPSVQQRAIDLYNLTLGPEVTAPSVWQHLSVHSILGWAEALAAGHKRIAAIRLCDWGVKQPGSADAVLAVARLRAQLQIQLAQYEAARSGLTGAMALLPAGTDLGPLQFEMGRAWRLDRNAGKSREWYLKATHSSDTDLATNAAAQAAWALTQQGQWTNALTEYAALVQRAPDSPYAEIGVAHLYTQAVREGRSEDMARWQQWLGDHFPRKGGRRNTALYFSSGDVSPIPFTAYGQYARASGTITHAPDLLADCRVGFDSLYATETTAGGAALLAGLWDIAEADLCPADLMVVSPDSWRIWADGFFPALRGEDPRTIILSTQEFWDRYGQVQIPPGWSELLMDAAYPLDYRAEIEAAATASGFAPSFVFALVRQESYFNAKAGSGAGAKGLMQLMPPTAKWAAEQTGMGAGAAKHLDDPATNLRLGCWHLGFLRTAVGDSDGLILAAHNGGPGNLAKWEESIPLASTNEPLFIELIPNQETREFVKQVLANQAVYDYLLAREGEEVRF